MSKLPTAAWICLTVAFMTVVVAFVILSNNGTDATEFRSFLNTILNLVGLLLGGGALAFAGQAAKQTNGNLDARIKQAVQAALDAQRTTDVKPGGVFEGGQQQ